MRFGAVSPPGNSAGSSSGGSILFGPYIADFCCIPAGLVVELDGDTHADKEAHDANRTDWLNARGYHVIRFTNGDVHERLSVVLDAILAACEEKSN